MDQMNKMLNYILIVDDVPANLKILGEILKSEGYKVRPVPSGTLALQVVEKDKPDLILLDIMMPGMDGYEVCRKLKENNKLSDIPVIFISALNETEDVVKALKLGGVDFITKPFQQEEVKARVATHLKIRQQSKELLELNASKDKFFSIIAHDLRSPFNGFLGLTELMAEDLPSMPLPMIQKYVVMLRDSASNLYRLLDNLLQWSKVQRGLITISMKKIDLNELINECVLSVIEPAKKKEIEIITDISEPLKVLADQNMMQTVIRNILSNAVKFTPKGGKVNIFAKNLENNRVEISIKDSGIGMNQTLVNNLFRIDVNTGRKGTDDEPSSGLGLILCKEFIEKQGGILTIESVEKVGSTFKFTIPIE